MSFQNFYGTDRHTHTHTHTGLDHSTPAASAGYIIEGVFDIILALISANCTTGRLKMPILDSLVAYYIYRDFVASVSSIRCVLILRGREHFEIGNVPSPAKLKRNVCVTGKAWNPG